MIYMDTRRVSGSQICVSPAPGHTKCESAGQNLRFACAKHSSGSRSDCFPCAGPHKTRLGRSKFAFRLRRATKNASRQVKKEDLDRSVFPAQGHKKRAPCRFCAGSTGMNAGIRILERIHR